MTRALDRLGRRLLKGFFARFFTRGQLEVAFPGGQSETFGDGSGPALAIRIADPGAVWAIARNPQLGLGETYVSGRLLVERGTLGEFLSAMLENGETFKRDPYIRALVAARMAVARWISRNTRARSRRNAAHAYDLDDRFFRLFLDDNLQYTCAFFTDDGMSIDQAQQAKQALIARKLLLRPGQRVLDIGCGWGGLAIDLARRHGVSVTGVTLSENQARVGQERVRAEGLEGQVEIRCQDFRDVTGSFDRIAAIGVLEHVGLRHFDTFFGSVRRALEPDGVALVHAIARVAPPEPVDAWLTRHMFPGGYIPSVSQACAAIEGNDLWLNDVDIWRLHYAETLRHWHQRFQANSAEVEARFGAEFRRMWSYFLVGSEMTFRHQRICVAQFQLSRRRDIVPPSRGYQYADGSARLGAGGN